MGSSDSTLATGSDGLYSTVTEAARFLFGGGVYDAAERDALAERILAGQNRRKGFIFHPTDGELADGVRLLSGEKARTRLLAANAVELETLRLLALLRPEVAAVQQLFDEADARLAGTCFGRVCATGECAAASIAVLRYRAARARGGGGPWLDRGLAALREDRRGDGRWRRFPFHFTLLWLVELPGDAARDELAYAAAAVERVRFVFGRERPERSRWAVSPAQSKNAPLRSVPGAKHVVAGEIRAAILRRALAAQPGHPTGG